MRALKIAGVVAVALWMAWMTLRVEMAARAANQACDYAVRALSTQERLDTFSCGGIIGFQRYSN
jgi:hypothetical protein